MREGGRLPSLSFLPQVTQQVTHPTPAKNRKNRYSLDMNEKCEINFSNKIVVRKQKKRRKTQSFNGVNLVIQREFEPRTPCLLSMELFAKCSAISDDFGIRFYRVTHQVTQCCDALLYMHYLASFLCFVEIRNAGGGRGESLGGQVCINMRGHSDAFVA